MKTTLRQRLLDYLEDNHPEFIVQRAEEYSVNDYLNDKLDCAAGFEAVFLEQGHTGEQLFEKVFDALISPLKPSKANYIRTVMSEEFKEEFELIRRHGVMRYELVNLVHRCYPIFSTFEFSEKNINDRFLRNSIIAEMHDYLIDFSSKQPLKADNANDHTK